MIDELFFKRGHSGHIIDYALFGFAVTVIGFLTALTIFGRNSSVAQILIITLLIIPAVLKLFAKEEKITRIEGLRHVVRNHSNVFRIFIFMFIGIFVAFFMLQLAVAHYGNAYLQVFGYQLGFIESYQEQSYGIVSSFTQETSGITKPIVSIVRISLLLTILSFILSFFYGAGGIFLLVLLASMLSMQLIYLMKATTFWHFSLVHFILLFLLAAPMALSSVGGGILSKAFVAEAARAKYFRNVLKDSFALFMASVFLTLLILIIWLAFMAVFARLM